MESKKITEITYKDIELKNIAIDDKFSTSIFNKLKDEGLIDQVNGVLTTIYQRSISSIDELQNHPLDERLEQISHDNEATIIHIKYNGKIYE